MGCILFIDSGGGISNHADICPVSLPIRIFRTRTVQKRYAAGRVVPGTSVRWRGGIGRKIRNGFAISRGAGFVKSSERRLHLLVVDGYTAQTACGVAKESSAYVSGFWLVAHPS